MLLSGIRTVNVERDDTDTIRKVRLVFGPHYFVELRSNKAGHVEFILGATHHGFRADASEVNGELEKIIYEVRDQHTDKLVD